MKKMMVGMLLLLTTAPAFAQQADSLLQPKTRDQYLYKSKGQLVGGLVLLGLGATMIGVAAPGNVSFDVLPVLAVGGTVCVLTSIPLLLASGRNKRKARYASAHFEIRAHPAATPAGPVLGTAPTVSVRLGF